MLSIRFLPDYAIYISLYSISYYQRSQIALTQFGLHQKILRIIQMQNVCQTRLPE